MSQTKTHSRKGKKRKFTGNHYTKRKSSASADASVPEDKNTELSGDEEHVECEKFQNFKYLSASQRKLETKSHDSLDESSGMKYANLQWLTIIDLSVLATVLASLWCPSCRKENVCPKDKESKTGVTSLLILKCTAAKCFYRHSFYTSSKIENKQAFEA